ncbi:MFS transporter [Streptomyces sp. TR06-5]|uniref:MFS transporter n=1 Tax=unclassified Streptomyces TaxID=2593676 RepID=UPI0039A365EE
MGAAGRAWRTVTAPETGEPAGSPGGAPPRRESVLGPSYRALTAGIVSVVLLIAFEATAVGTAMPAAAAELHGVALYAFAFSAFFTTSLFGITVSGLWCDRRGPLPALAAGIAAFALGLLTAGTAPTMLVLVLGRAVQGIGGGLVIVALYVAVGRVYPEHLRPAVMAAFAASWVVPAIVGPLVSGTVTERFGWRWVFLGLPLLVVLPLAAMLPPLRRRAAGAPPGAATDAPPDLRRVRLALCVAAGAALLQYAGQDLRAVALLPAAAGAALLFPAALRLLPRGIHRAARGLPAVVLLRGIAAGAFVTAESFLPLMLVTQRGLTVTRAGLVLAAGGATWALGSFLQSRSRMEPYRHGLVRLGTVLIALAVAYPPVALVEAVPVWTLVVVMAAGCFGMGLVLSSLSVLLLRLSAPEHAGGNSAALQTSDGLWSIVLLAAAGAVFAAAGGGAPVAHASVSGVSEGAAPAAAGFVAVHVLAALAAALGVVVAGRLREAS